MKDLRTVTMGFLFNVQVKFNVTLSNCFVLPREGMQGTGWGVSGCVAQTLVGCGVPKTLTLGFSIPGGGTLC